MRDHSLLFLWVFWLMVSVAFLCLFPFLVLASSKETWHTWQKDVLQVALASQTPAGAPDPGVGTSSLTMLVSQWGQGTPGHGVCGLFRGFFFCLCVLQAAGFPEPCSCGCGRR